MEPAVRKERSCFLSAQSQPIVAANKLEFVGVFIGMIKFSEHAGLGAMKGL